MTSSTASLPLRRPRALAVLAAAAAIVIGTYVLGGNAASAPRAATESAVDAPQAGAGEAAPLDGGGAPTGSLERIDHNLSLWTKNLRDNPSDFLAATNIATLYQGRARLSHDLGDHERALQAARTALSIVPTHGPARSLEAAILHSLHDFEAAFEAADALIREDPSQLAAVATRFDAALELGRIDEARRDLTRLDRAGGAAVHVRDARFRSVTGDAAGALERAVAAERAANADDGDDMGFYAYAVGEYARLAGDPLTARDAFARALAVRADDVAALIGLARIDAFDGRVDDAIAGLQRATTIVPQPESLALLGDLHTQRASGSRDAAEAFETVRFIATLGELQAAAYDRQLLRFELDHGGASDELLARARQSIARRPDASGHDAVAWTLYRLGRFDEAAASIAAARALGADDARLRYHEGAIRLALGDGENGGRLVRSALERGPALDPIERAEAEMLEAG